MNTKKFDNTMKSLTEHHSEAKIIDFKGYAQYNKKLSEIMEMVNDLGDDIYNSMFGLACLDKWKAWDAEQPIGAEIYVTDEMLRNTGDKNIDLLWQILDKIMDVKEEIHVSQPKNDTTEDEDF